MPQPPDSIVKLPENRICADCAAREPRWASVNLGIFICETCAGIHRDMGTHISKVKSTKLDEWKPEMIACAKAIGNKRSNAYYEHSVPDGVKYVGNVNSAGGDKIDEGEAKKLRTWIRAKYEQKKYATPGVDEPSKRHARGESLDAGGGGGGGGAGGGGDGGLVIGPPGGEEKSPKKSSRRERSRKEPKEIAVVADAPPVPEEQRSPKAAKKEKKRDGSRKRSRKEERSGEDLMFPAGNFGDDMGGNFGGGNFGGCGYCGTPQSYSPQHQQPQQYGGPEMQPQQQHYPQQEQQQMQYQQQQQHQYPQQEAGWANDGAGNFAGGPQATDQHYPTAPGAYGGYNSGGMQGDMPAAPGAYGGHNSGGMQVQPDIERQAALQSVAMLLKAPDQVLGVKMGPGEELMPLFGFDTMRAEFHPTALRRRREPGQLPVGGSGDVGLPLGAPFIVPTSMFTPPAAPTPTFTPPAPVVPARPPPRDADDWLEESLGIAKATKASSSSKSWRATVAAKGAGVLEGARDKLVAKGYDRFSMPEAAEPGGFAAAPGSEASPSAALSPAAVKAALGSEFGGFQEELRRLREEMRALRKSYSKLKDEQPPPVVGPPPAAAEDVQPGGGAGAEVGAAVAATSSSAAPPADKAAVVQPMEREAFDAYLRLFREHDRERRGHIRGREARALLESTSRLGPLELGVIWGLCDVDRDGALSIEEFACAMHLVRAREAGGELRHGLPPELFQAAAEFARQAAPDLPVSGAGAQAASQLPWAIPPADVERYAAIFAALDTHCLGSVGGAEARVALEATRLPTAELAQIWGLSDIDGDGRLTFGELACALHLVSRLAHGEQLPAQLPAELVAVLRTVESAAPTPPVAMPPPPTVAHSVAHSPWRLEADDLASYRQVFDTLDRRAPELLEADEVADIMARSGLPSDELARIARLADADGDGRFTFPEFACGLHLISRRRQGWELPAALPIELLVGSRAGGSHSPAGSATPSSLPQAPSDIGFATALLGASGAGSLLSRRLSDTASSVGGAVSTVAPSTEHPPAPAAPPAAASEAAAGSPSSWRIGPDQRHAFDIAFAAHAGTAAGATMSADDARQLLERTGLPPAELMHVWRLADADGDGRLTADEFACAMHIAARRRQGTPLPPTLPPELAVLLGCAGAPGGGAEASAVVSPWAVTAEQLAEYAAVFNEVRRPGATFLDTDVAREVLDRSALDRADLAHIWRLADANCDGRLELGEFVCALHLTARRREGHSLPPELPPELAAAKAAAASSGAGGGVFSTTKHLAGRTAAEEEAALWLVDAATMERYAQIWEGIDRIHPDVLSSDEAREFLDRSQLPREELWHIWSLADVNEDGQLTFGEFLCTMHLVSRRLAGADLPPSLPHALQLLVSQPAPPSPQSRQAPLAAGSFGSAGGAGGAGQAESWEVAPERWQAYADIFYGVPRTEPGFLASDEARELLERSGLPIDELSHVWILSDVDGDGRLSLPEFICAMHLVTARRAGARLPATLPDELASSAALLGSPGGRDAAIWAPSAEELGSYRTLFEALDTRGVGRLGPEDLMEVMQRSGVDPNEQAHVLQMADVDRDGQLTAGEFVCAIHLLSRLRRGMPLPSELPAELSRLAAGAG